MDKMNVFVEGVCDQMCPENEIKVRTREKLVHFFEKNPENQRVESARFVKAFARSAAGKTIEAHDLRTLRALRVTVNYLLTVIIADKRKPFHFVYDFIFDRLRAVRQEIVMQNLSPGDTLTLIEPIIFFLIYSRYRLCEQPLANFDPKICRQHTTECIQTALVCYDQGGEQENRYLFEAIYLVTNLGNVDALMRGISVARGMRSGSNRTFEDALKMSLLCWQKNYYRVLEMWSTQPTICCLAATENVPDIREKFLTTLATAYHSKHLTVPLEWLVRILRYGDRCQLQRDLQRLNVEIINGTDAKFDKVAFEKREKNLVHCREAIVEEKLTTHPFSLNIKFSTHAPS
uniref:SAC3/GANP/THP3 conserved domain-containing protein n=2 Tax=Lutzomyia longipalpis TaxID=7200 RepID=A0A1B0CVX2_LUTLO